MDYNRNIVLQINCVEHISDCRSKASIIAKKRSKRKTRSDKFPLTLHTTGQYCKKVRGRCPASTIISLNDNYFFLSVITSWAANPEIPAIAVGICDSGGCPA